MKKLSELGINNAPWDGVTFCHPGMNGYVVSNANLPEGDTRRKIVASDVLTKNARLIAAAPDLYEASYDVVTYCENNHLVPSEQFRPVLARLRAALAKAAGEEVDDSKRRNHSRY